jgi:hypothetical protein
MLDDSFSKSKTQEHDGRLILSSFPAYGGRSCFENNIATPELLLAKFKKDNS